MPLKTRVERSRYQAEWMNKRRDQWLKENGPCVSCGSSDGLEVDHINPREKTSHRIWSLSETRRNAELAKCHVLCHACHAAKHKSARIATLRRNDFYPPSRRATLEMRQAAMRARHKMRHNNQSPIEALPISTLVCGADDRT